MTRKKTTIYHDEKVDTKNIKAEFSADKLHRFSLTVPLLERSNKRTICIIGQNPSSADEHEADKTLAYLERYIFEKLPQYSMLIMLNLYSRIDTKKTETTDIQHPDYDAHLNAIISQYSDYLIVYGELKTKGSYKFKEKAKEMKERLNGKNVFKINLQNKTSFAPHPGNYMITYNNKDFGVTSYNFEDT